jgi:hypothetical protein
MGRKKKGAPVVITRKDKRLNKTGHGLAFLLTGGMSSVYTATKAATNAGYNARTRRLVEQNEATEAQQEAAAAQRAAADAGKAECPGCGARYVLVPNAAGMLVKLHDVPGGGPRCKWSGKCLT